MLQGNLGAGLGGSEIYSGINLTHLDKPSKLVIPDRQVKIQAQCLCEISDLEVEARESSGRM